MILLIDNYDSFVHNLARYFERLDQPTHVVRNDAIDVAGIEALAPSAIVLSPGPCTPAEAGCSLDVVRQFAGKVPILGVCLGHQAIAAALGAAIVRAREPMHGRTSQVWHAGRSVFAGLPNPLTACRYHSLVVDRATLPDCLEVAAWTLDQTIMAVAHRQWPLVGVQFHPESILTDEGYPLLANFLRGSGVAEPSDLPPMTSERIDPVAPIIAWPDRPVTF
ncbi:MAG: aminodeoxychorismate/anthranilate synthase component II [Pirellulales bacterium]